VSPSLPVVSGRQAIRALETLGYEEVSRRGSHVKLRNESGRTVIVPDHRELARGTLASILRQAGVQIEDFLDSL
jgi:predicted RNA binding protein YcfA (HicA-like mRNA interferase family)